MRIFGKHSVYTHFPRDRKCEISQRTKITRARAEDALAKPYLELQNFGDLITADRKVLSEGCESRNNHRCAVVVQDLPPNGSSRIRAKKKLLRKHKEACKSSGGRMRSLKSFTLTIPRNLAKAVKIFLESLYVNVNTDRKQMGLLREQYAE